MARKAASIADYRNLAKQRLPRFLFEYIDGGAFDEVTLRRNESDLRAVELRQRVMRDVSNIDVSTAFFSQKARLPLALAPIGVGGMMARRGVVQAVRAASAAGVPFALSTMSACAIEEVRSATAHPFWFQLYMIRDRGFMRDLLGRARTAECSALMFTVDLPVPGSRYRDYRSGFAGAGGLAGSLRRIWQGCQRPAWAWDVGVMGRPHKLGNVAPVLGASSGLEDFFRWLRENFDPSVTWRDIEWVRSEWNGPLIVKGVLEVEDAREAVRSGASGVVVSNHGGRQLDGVRSATVALPEIAEAIGGGATILADGGVRSGLDLLRMIALGADGVLIGRPWIYALAARGRAGVTHVLELMEAELRVAMALTGVTRIADISSEIIRRKQI